MEGCLFIPSHWGTFRLTDEPLDEPPRFLRKAWMDAELPEPPFHWSGPEKQFAEASRVVPGNEALSAPGLP